MPPIVFLQVGGTIDKDYPEGATDHGYEFKIGEPGFLSTLERAKPRFAWTYDTLLRKDSLDMTDEDRALVREKVAELRLDKIVLTHSTDTIHKTAEALFGIQGKTMVLTGALLPEKFRDSDADFNLGIAVAATQCLPYGVYIALYGEVVRWDKFVPR